MCFGSVHAAHTSVRGASIRRVSVTSRVMACVSEAVVMADSSLGFGKGHRAGHFSATVFNLARPASKSPPTILSMLKNTWKIFAQYGALPFIVQVTVVLSPVGVSVNSTLLCAVIGRVMFRSSATLDGAGASVISMLPPPTLLLPSQAYVAPLPAVVGP